MKQTVLTFITRVKPDRVSELDAVLKEIAGDLLGNPHLPFPALKRLHFASLVLHEDAEYGPYLVFENNFDGELDAYLADLYDSAAAGLHRIYGCCSDFPATDAADRARLLAYLKAHVVGPSAYHIGNLGRSAERVRAEDRLRNHLEDFLDVVVRRGSLGQPPASTRKEVQDFVRSEAGFDWAARAEPGRTRSERLRPWLKIGCVALLALALLPALLPLAVVWLVMLRRKESRDTAIDTVSKAHVSRLVEREDRTHVVQNHMASITLVKPGVFRRTTLRGVLWLVNLLARTQTNGRLGGISSIHFAHWSLIDGGRRLLFLSNFDGSWENYLDDFIDKVSPGLTAIWSNTVDFPRTRFLVCDGARDGTRFKALARDKQIYTNVWFSAYPDLTVQTIDNNSAIRADLFTPLDGPATRAWLWRF